MLSEALITHLVLDARSHPSDEFSPEILRRLAPLLTKVKDGVAIPAYTEAQKLTTAQKLGLEDMPKSKINNLEARAEMYAKWLISPESMGAEEIAMANTYRWETDKMDYAEAVKLGYEIDFANISLRD
jgi:hypothetical protein